MDESNTDKPFHLAPGGPFYRLLTRMHLFDEDRYRVGLRISLYLCLTWIPLLFLSALGRTLAPGTTGLPLLLDPIPHARLLVALPLLLVAEAIIDPLLALAVQYLDTSGIVPEEELPRYREAIAKMARRRDSVLAEIILFLLTFGVCWFFNPGYSGTWLSENISSWAWSVSGEGSVITPAGWWYLVVSAPFLQFLLYRWIWRFGIWVGFLYRTSRLRLALMASHSDHTGGLIILGRGQLGFIVLFIAIAALMSAEVAHDILYNGYQLTAAAPAVIGHIVLSVAVIFGPLLFFTRQMMVVKRKALWEYGTLQYQLSNAFHRHWVIGKAKDLVDSEQSSSMADYGMVYEAVSSMIVVPLKPKWLILAATALLVPFVPLLLTKYSIADILKRILDTFI